MGSWQDLLAAVKPGALFRPGQLECITALAEGSH